MWHPDMPESYRDAIVTGDARELAKAIPDESVDLIFTDPVYDRIDDYRWLAETAVRVLRQNSAALVWGGIGNLDSQLAALGAGGLDYRWQFILYYTNREKPQHVDAGWSKYASLLWLDKGRLPTRRGIDLLPCPVFTDLDSTGGRLNHLWSKPTRFLLYILSLFDGPTICDPFTGGGSIPAVCKMLGRHYVAFEIDPATADRARERVANTTPPLPGIDEPVQLEMEEV